MISRSRSSLRVDADEVLRERPVAIMQDDFFISSNRASTVRVMLTNDRLLWSSGKPVTGQSSHSLKQQMSLESTHAAANDERISESGNFRASCDSFAQSGEAATSVSRSSVFRSSRSCPNGFNADHSSSYYSLGFSDIVGCESARGSSKQDQACYLRVYAYPLIKKFPWQNVARRRKELVFGFSKESTFEKNLEKLENWVNAIKTSLKRHSRLPVEQDIEPHVGNRRKLLVFVNPFSGAGKALHLFQDRVIPILAEAGVHYETVITEYNGHARDVVKKMDLQAWGGVVVVSGDGLIYEVINGLMERSDCTEAIKMPIGVVPGGSGNALVTSLLFQAGESVKNNIVTSSCLLLVKNRVKPMDLVAIDTCTGRRLYSFLSVTWGIVADVDIESEKYRNLGKARFTVGAIARIVDLRKYTGKLHFLPINPAFKSKWSTYDRSPCQITYGNQPSLNNDEEAGNVEHLPDASEFDQSERNSSNTAGEGDPSNGLRRISTPLLNPLNKPVPSSWITMVANDFVTVVAIYQTHLAQDMRVVPHSRLKDGCIYLGIIRGNISRLKVLRIFNAMQDGSFEILEDECCEVVKVAAFRLEPAATQGIISVDGEVVDFGPIQGQVVEGISRIIA